MNTFFFQKKNRLDYIDYLKAFTMFGVVWIHSFSPIWLSVLYVDFAFFFLSGFFYKREKFNSFFNKKFNKILIPFLIFHFLYYPYNLLWYYWDHKTLEGFEWYAVIQFFVNGHIGTLVPLWFLFCLFSVQLFYYFISYLNKNILLLFSIITIFFARQIFETHLPYYIHSTIICISYFALGNLTGKYIINAINNENNRKSLFLFCTILYSIFLLVSFITHNEYILLFIKHIRYLNIYIILLIIFSYFPSNRITQILLFYGKNTLAMLCIHVSILRFFNRLGFKLFQNHDPIIGFGSTVFTFIIAYFVIKFINKRLPWLVGKKDILKLE